MVKIRIKMLLLCIVMGILLANTVLAARQALEFTDVSVKVGGKTSKNLRNGDTINEDAKPGDNLEFRIKVKSNFTSSENLKIRDITVKTTIEGIDDGSDLEDETSSFTLDPGDEKRVTLKFDVPWEVDEDRFNSIIEVEGDDKNSTNQKIQMTLKLDVNKDSHLLKITRKTLNPEQVSCNRKNVQLGATVVNIGTDDEKDISLRIANPNIGVDLRDTINELIAEPNQDGSRFSKTYSFSVPDTLEAGSYPITLRLLYNNDNKKTEETLNLDINDCHLPVKRLDDIAAGKNSQNSVILQEKQGELVVNQPKSAPSQQDGGSYALPQNVVLTQESFLKSNSFITLIIAAEIIAVIMGVALIIYLFGKK